MKTVRLMRWRLGLTGIVLVLAFIPRLAGLPREGEQDEKVQNLGPADVFRAGLTLRVRHEDGHESNQPSWAILPFWLWGDGSVES